MTDRDYMRLALEEAQKALAGGEIPIGAVVVTRGIVVAAGHNQREKRKDPTSHAEMEAIREASSFLDRWRLTDSTLYVTIEPCPMCAGAILNARLGRVVYGAANPLYGALSSRFHMGDGSLLNHQVDVKGGVLAAECQELMAGFFAAHRDRTV